MVVGYWWWCSSGGGGGGGSGGGGENGGDTTERQRNSVKFCFDDRKNLLTGASSGKELIGGGHAHVERGGGRVPVQGRATIAAAVATVRGRTVGAVPPGRDT